MDESVSRGGELRLILMRHAKSAWDTPAASDHARPLNERGRKDAPRIATALIGRGWVPERVVSSDAQRTIETWERMAGVFTLPPPVTFTRALYHAGLGELQRALEALEEEDTVMVIGHNPGFEEAIGWLAGEDVVLKTAHAALLTHAGHDWDGATHDLGGWRLQDVLRP